jgi:hypothetical protein
MTVENIIEQGFNKTLKNKWVFWNDYVLEDINPEYSYFLYATLHVPKKESKDIEYNFCKIILHRHYDLDFWNEESDYYDTKTVYEGLIESNEDLTFLLKKTGTKGKEN